MSDNNKIKNKEEVDSKNLDDTTNPHKKTSHVTFFSFESTDDGFLRGMQEINEEEKKETDIPNNHKKPKHPTP